MQCFSLVCGIFDGGRRACVPEIYLYWWVLCTCNAPVPVGLVYLNFPCTCGAYVPAEVYTVGEHESAGPGVQHVLGGREHLPEVRVSRRK